MSYITVHGLKLATGATIENAVFESLPTLTDEQLQASPVGRIYYDSTLKALFGVALSGDGTKKVSLELTNPPYVSNTTSPMLSGAESFYDADNLLEAAIVGLSTDVDKRLDDLENKQSTSKFEYISLTEELSHTIEHNLNSDFVECSVWVKDLITGKYSMDLVSIVESTKNKIVIDLTEPRIIKAICRK